MLEGEGCSERIQAACRVTRFVSDRVCLAPVCNLPQRPSRGAPWIIQAEAAPYRGGYTMNGRFPARRRPPFVYVLLLAAYVGGVLADRSGWLPGSSQRPPPGLGHTFDPFWETWHLVQRHYVDRDAVQPQRMTRGAIEGMLASLGDVGHTMYLSPEELQQVTAELKGYLEGIGA